MSAWIKLLPVQNWGLDNTQIRGWWCLDIQIKPTTRSEKKSSYLRLKILEYLIWANSRAN